MGVADRNNSDNNDDDDDESAASAAQVLHFAHLNREPIINAVRYTCDLAVMICQRVPITSRCLLLVGMMRKKNAPARRANGSARHRRLYWCSFPVLLQPPPPRFVSAVVNFVYNLLFWCFPAGIAAPSSAFLVDWNDAGWKIHNSPSVSWLMCAAQEDQSVQNINAGGARSCFEYGYRPQIWLIEEWVGAARCCRVVVSAPPLIESLQEKSSLW